MGTHGPLLAFGVFAVSYAKPDLKFMKGKFDRGPNVRVVPHEELRKRSEEHAIFTEFGNCNWSTSVRNRSAPLTVIIGEDDVCTANPTPRQQDILANLPATLETVQRYMGRAPFVKVQRTMGQNDLFAPRCTLYSSIHRPDCVRLPYMWGNTQFAYDENAKGPELTIVFIPEWQEKDRQVLVWPKEGVTIALGSDYYGEVKKGFLRMAMWKAKEQGMLGLHAGSKIVRAKQPDGHLATFGMILFGLTATGKTTHTCHDHHLDQEGEGVGICQDDVIFMSQDGSCLGTEKGFFIKTDGLDKDEQPVLYDAAIKRDATFENILVDYTGKVDFRDDTLTGNGRGVVQFDDLGDRRAPSINLPPVVQFDGLIIVMITRRNTVLPMLTKLDPHQAAAAFLLGESVESSGGDPKKAGQSVRVVGFNPFVIGDPSDEGNRFYRFVEEHADRMTCYLLNTGGVGEKIEVDEKGHRKIVRKVDRVSVPESSAMLRGLVRGQLEWVREPLFGYLVPKEIPGVDMARFDPHKFYTDAEIEALVKDLKRERREYMAQFDHLDERIMRVFR
jgi:phosphoenolpyruvate carboxykinase (ATP)